MDGDLWEQAWEAVLERGGESVQAQWVKGHATWEMVDQGKVKARDKENSDRMDKYANKGILEHGEAEVRAVAWLAERHARYVKFIDRVRKVIVKVWSWHMSNKKL